MKKLITAMFALVMFTMMANAQTATTTARTTAKTTSAKVKAETAPAATKAKEAKEKTVTKVKTEKTTVTANGVKLKADGTPDKRYTKTASVAGPKKADGTADMRYKANQTAKTKTVKTVKKVEVGAK